MAPALRPEYGQTMANKIVRIGWQGYAPVSWLDEMFNRHLDLRSLLIRAQSDDGSTPESLASQN